MKTLIRPALSLFIALSLLTGLIYPLAMTWVAGSVFPAQAEGSLLQVNGQLVGSRLIGQPFSEPGHFWSRPSATAPNPDNGLASGGSNLAPTNPALIDGVKAHIAALRAADPTLTGPVPGDLVTASASGLDPDISPAAALLQVPRIAQARHLDAARVRALVKAHVHAPQWGFLGEARVNVLELNLALNALPG